MTETQSIFGHEVQDCVCLVTVVEERVRNLTGNLVDLPEGVEFQEVNANLMLAVRHLEDCRSRLLRANQLAGEEQ
jgi:hypothetical protein